MKPVRTLRRMDTTTLHERVYRELKQAIIRGHFAPGQAITIRSLAMTFGTSPMPARDALNRLVTERAVEMPNARSFRIPILKEAAFNELCDVRILLECHAVEIACRRLDGDALKRLYTLDAAVTRHFQQGDYESTLEANAELLFTLYSAASRDALLAHIESLWLQSGPYLVLRLRKIAEEHGSRRRDHIGHHEELLAALRMRNARAAAAALKQDIQETRAAYRSRIAASLR
jgi:DNA-binding GntR family transcriptional regulator